jgi:hypothetical protein
MVGFSARYFSILLSLCFVFVMGGDLAGNKDCGFICPRSSAPSELVGDYKVLTANMREAVSL